MATPQPATGPDAPTPGTRTPRVQRRKARTRQALIDAGRALLARKGDTGFSVQEITDEADVGLGSFYNHFEDKQQLLRAAVEDVLSEHGDLLDAWTRGIEDPAAVFTLSVRTTARLAATHPDLARVLVGHGLAYLSADHGLAPRALGDIRRGIETGRFTVSSAELGLAIAGGSLIALIHLQLQGPGHLDEEACDDLAEYLLTMFGMPRPEAWELAHGPLPDSPPAPRPDGL